MKEGIFENLITMEAFLSKLFISQWYRLMHRECTCYTAPMKNTTINLTSIWLQKHDVVGYIIWLEFLKDIYATYKKGFEIEAFALDDNVHEGLIKSIPGIQTVVSDTAHQWILVPALSAPLGYFDNFRSEEMPASLIQVQRYYFGSHTYELKGKKGRFHGEWEDVKN